MNPSPRYNHYDVIIVGARVAGAATGRLLAEAGLRVLVFDKGKYGTDTLSTHALMRPAILLLQRWGLVAKLQEAGTPAVRKTTFWYSDGGGPEVAEIDIKPRDGVQALYAPRRTVLDRILVDAAQDAGAEVVHGLRLVEVLGRDEGRVHGVVARDRLGRLHRISARLVIGADGRNSVVARQVGAATYAAGQYASTSTYGYFQGLPVDGYRWYYAPGTGAGALPTNDGLTLVFGSLLQKRSNESAGALRDGFLSTIARSAPDIAGALCDARLVGKLRNFPGMPGFLRQPWGPGWALVGDAGYLSDPITAHGITNALRDAELLSRTIVDGVGLGCYQVARDDLSMTFFEVSDRVASFDWDTPTVQHLHMLMSKEMRREEAYLNRGERDVAGDFAPQQSSMLR